MAERTGKCLCGAVGFTLETDDNGVGVCHCEMCRRWSAGPFMGLHLKGDVAFSGEENIGLYRGSEWAERGFCKNCGSALFWRFQDRSEIVVSAGLLDDQGDLEIGMQVYIDKKPGFYGFSQQSATMTEAEVVALFSGQGVGDADP